MDAIYINRLAEQPEIHVIQSKHHTSERKAANPFKASDLKKFRDFLRVLKDREADLEKLSNPVLQEKILEIRELLQHHFPLLKVWCISNGNRCVPHEYELFENEIAKFDAQLEEFHLSEFYNFCILARSKRTDHAFHARGGEVVEFSSGAVKGVLGLISAEQLFNLILDITDPTSLDYGIFDLNIRGFLGSDNQINKQIYRSAVSEQNSRFWCLNNGITMTCSRFELRRLAETPKVGAKNLCIVNGAQTCGAIFQAINDFSLEWSRFKDLAVSFRLYETLDPQFVEDIAISSNSQNRVNSRDLKANHSHQLALEEELEKRGIRYLRKRGITEDYSNFVDTEGEDIFSNTSIDALKVGQIWLSYSLKQPERAKRDSDAIFESLYEPIFGSIEITELQFAIQLYWIIMYRRAVVEDEIRIRGSRAVGRDFITYGVFHVLYACRLIVLRDSKKRLNKDALVDEAIELVDNVVREAGNPAYYTFFRRPRTAELIEDYGKTPTLFDYLD